jgi:phosphatidylinositol glycan class T
LLVDFINDSLYPINATYFESIPWILKFYLHTLSIVDDKNRQIVPKEILYIPAVDRKSPTVMEMVFVIPAKSILQLTIDFEYQFIRFSEHHPDANHGFDIGYNF